MKSIEVSDEMYDKLISLATEMTTQDPRGTKMPHMFQIRDWKKQYDWGLNGDTRIYVDDYSQEIETFDEFKEYLNTNESIQSFATKLSIKYNMPVEYFIQNIIKSLEKAREIMETEEIVIELYGKSI